MMVLVLSFGPVQGFLAAGRKTRDLAWGSRLLSTVVAAAARAVAKQAGASLVAPLPDELDRDLPVANKIVAQLPAEAVQSAVKAACNAARNELKRIANAALDGLGKIEVDRPLFDDQIARFLEMVHAFCPLNGSFGVARERAERALDGRKALRDFSGYAGKGGRPKASVDGRLECVLDRTALEALGQRFGPAMFTPGEQLDAMGIVRRLWQPDAGRATSWPSTGGIAVSAWVRAVTSTPDGRAKLDEANRLRVSLNRTLKDVPEFEALEDDSSWLLTPSDYSVAALEDLVSDAPPQKKEAVAQVQRAFAEHVSALRRLASRSPTSYPYYAIVSADGDRLGSALAKLESLEQHQQAARVLARFAESVGRLETPTLRVVYAGGDDVIALMPVDDALPFCVRLVEEFERAVEPVAWRDGAPTLSAGIAIVHARDALHAGIALAGTAERAAKNDGGDRLGIVLSKRSGADVSVVLPRARIAAFIELAAALASGEAPRGLAYELRDLGMALSEVADRDLAIREVKRVLTRKRGSSGQLLTPAKADLLLGFAHSPSVKEACQEISAYLRVAAACVEYSQPQTFAGSGATAGIVGDRA